MKKIAILLAAVLTASAGYAQQTEETTPNRILVTNTAGNYTGYVIDYLSDISFARVDGEVLANIEIDEVNLTEMTLSITRTPECFSYKLAVLPQVTANRLTDDVSAIKYINSLPSGQVPVLYEDYDKGTLSGIELNPELQNEQVFGQPLCGIKIERLVCFIAHKLDSFLGGVLLRFLFACTYARSDYLSV